MNKSERNHQTFTVTFIKMKITTLCPSRWILLCVLLMIAHQLLAQDQSPMADQKILQSLAQVSSQPNIKPLINAKAVNHTGGHLQGVQLLKFNHQSLAVLSGSSGTDAYYATVNLVDPLAVDSIIKIDSAPFKHAGGFQIYDRYLAIGIEDNEARTRSYVGIYYFTDDLNPPSQPLIKIERSGPYERSTAGCVGITAFRDKLLVAVGDWNTRHLDFYLGTLPQSKEDTFILITSIGIDTCDRSDWIDQVWLPYQNINLIHNEEGTYIIGLAADSSAYNTIDVFKLMINDLHISGLKKIGSKQLLNRGSDFRWGAGISIENGKIETVISCDRNLTSMSHLYFYDTH